MCSTQSYTVMSSGCGKITSLSFWHHTWDHFLCMAPSLKDCHQVLCDWSELHRFVYTEKAAAIDWSHFCCAADQVAEVLRKCIHLYPYSIKSLNIFHKYCTLFVHKGDSMVISAAFFSCSLLENVHIYTSFLVVLHVAIFIQYTLKLFWVVIHKFVLLLIVFVTKCR